MAETISIPGFSEPFSSLSHLLGAVVFLVLSVPLLKRGRGNTARTVSLLVFCVGTVILLSISGVYHLLDPAGNARYVLRRLDHAAIFVLIACSFTPIHIILLRGWRRWGVLLVMWTFAIVAIALKTIYFAELTPRQGLAMYLAMGWAGLYTVFLLWRRFGFEFILPAVYGGLAYSVGAVFENLHLPILLPGVIQWHEVFHVAVLIGLGFHWAFVFQIADGRTSPQSDLCDGDKA